jgi:hypothetical protein
MKMSTEKVKDDMGSTKQFKVKSNDKTVMRLDKDTLKASMTKIRAEGKAKARKNEGFLSKALDFVTGKKS